jgi:DNA-3-methyladenine glycosylase II
MRHAIDHLSKNDPVLAAIIKRKGDCTMSYLKPDFGTLVRSIANQQISGKAAKSILNRLTEAVGGGDYTPENILKLSPQKMRKCGFSAQKTAYIRDLAKQSKAGKIDYKALPKMTDEEVIATLTQVKGIGVWTAHMFLMFALKRENVLPTGDLGVRAAIKKAYKTRGTKKDPYPKARQIEKLAKNWHPYCSVATWYLWRSLEGEAQL